MVIDCEVHTEVPGTEALYPYLEPHWMDYIANTSFDGAFDTWYPPALPTSLRPDLRARAGGGGARVTLANRAFLSEAAGDDESESDPAEITAANRALLAREVFDVGQADLAVLSCVYAVESIHNPDAACAFASAINDWLIEQWLERDARLRGSIVLPSRDPVACAKEIERVGGHPGFVQVFLPVRSRMLYGSRACYPLFEAANAHELAVAIHFGGATGYPPTSSGRPSYYMDEYVGMACAFQAQLTSLVAEGTFVRYPDLRVVLLESGFAWLPAFMWRFDKDWKSLRGEVPWVSRSPSEYLREHVRVSTAPYDIPLGDDHLRRLIDWLGTDGMLVYGSDFPHWQVDGPGSSILDYEDQTTRARILAENARSIYRRLG